MDGLLEHSVSLLESSKKLQAFRKEVKVLAARWPKRVLRIPAAPSDRRKSLKAHIGQKIVAHHKSAKTKLCVTVAGQPITQNRASDVFSSALERMGLDRVAKLDKRLSGIALVSRHPATAFQNQKLKDGWFITTHASNADMKPMLESIGAELQIPVRVDIDI